MLTIAEHTHLLNNIIAVITPKCFKQTQCLRKMALSISIWKGNTPDLSLWLLYTLSFCLYNNFHHFFLTTPNTFTPLTPLFFSVLTWAIWVSVNMQALAVYHRRKHSHYIHTVLQIWCSIICHRKGTKDEHFLPFPLVLYTSIMSRFNISYKSKRLYIAF